MFLDVKDFITSKFLKNEINKTRMDEILGVIELEMRRIASEHDFQKLILRLQRTQFPELKGYFRAYRMKAGEWMDGVAVERIEMLMDENKWDEAEQMMGLLEQLEDR